MKTNKPQYHETEELFRFLHKYYLKSKGKVTQRQIGSNLGLRAGTHYVNVTFRAIERNEPVRKMGDNNLKRLREYVESLKISK